MMEAGPLVTVNSDDPPYLGGYVTENLLACREALDLLTPDIVRLVRKGVRGGVRHPGGARPLPRRS
jgi:adenosine deaminase